MLERHFHLNCASLNQNQIPNPLSQNDKVTVAINDKNVIPYDTGPCTWIFTQQGKTEDPKSVARLWMFHACAPNNLPFEQSNMIIFARSQGNIYNSSWK